MSFGKRVKQRRKEIGLTQKEASEKSGISPAHWAFFEQETRMPSTENLIKIKRTLASSYDWLLEGEKG